MVRILSLIALIVSATALVALTLSEADGCAGVPPLDHPSIQIAEETAIIVWDPVKKVQHFIRRAAFDTKAPDFGFLVPTPTLPQLPLAEVEDGIFRATESWILPVTIEQTQWNFEPLLYMFAPPTKMAAPMRGDKGAAGGVNILHEQKVGGFEVKILEAEDADALTKWIKEHGYTADPELYAWLKPYVDARWKITAFKISQDPKSGQLATTKAVRMSFTTERPFFPYREPERKADKKGGAKSKPAPTEIDGIWQVESAEGKHAVDLQGTTFWFGEGVAVGRFMKDVPYTVDGGKEPKWLDFSYLKGIYKLDGDTLHWCQGTASARPSAFDAKEGTLLVLRRGKKADADAAAAGVAAREHERVYQGGRLLRVSFVSDARVDGKLGPAAWHASIPWSDALTDAQRKQLAKETGVPEEDLPASAWMTTFEDRASPRPGKEEVYFEPAAERTPIRPTPFIKYNVVHIPFDCVLVGVVAAALVVITWIKLQRMTVRKKANPPEA